MGQQHVPLKIDEKGNVIAVGSINDNNFDTCVLCGVETPYKRSTHIDMRIGYIEGAGQLCARCYADGSDRVHISVPVHVIYNTPNDAELGAKIRQMYWNNLG
jgi:uncharacterized protein CbrC (UPF0167 family)